MAFKEGDEIDFDKIIATTKEINRLSVFIDFKIEYSVVDVSKKLVDIYIVGKEASIVDEVKITGNKSISSEDLKEVMYISKGDYLSEYKIYASILGIKRKYREEGLLDVDVNHYISLEGNKLILNFDIKEGPRNIVKAINFIGVSNVNVGDLKGIMDTKEEVRFLGIPINKGYFDQISSQKILKS